MHCVEAVRFWNKYRLLSERLSIPYDRTKFGSFKPMLKDQERYRWKKWGAYYRHSIPDKVSSLLLRWWTVKSRLIWHWWCLFRVISLNQQLQRIKLCMIVYNYIIYILTEQTLFVVLRVNLKWYDAFDVLGVTSRFPTSYYFEFNLRMVHPST